MKKLIVVQVAMALAMAACAVPRGFSGDPTAGPTRTAMSTTPDKRCEPTTLRTKDARAVDKTSIIRGEKVIPGREGAEQVTTLAASPTGELLQEIGAKNEPSSQGPAELHPGRLRTLDPATGRTTIIRGKRQSHANTQSVFAALDNQYAVWDEEVGTDLATTNWTIYAANRKTGRIVRVAAAHPVDANGTTPTVPGYTIPTIAHGRVFWAEARQAGKNGAEPPVNVYSRPLDLSQPTRLEANDSAMPVATGDWLYYVSVSRDKSKRIAGYLINRKSLRTGQIDLIHQAKLGGSDLMVSSLTAFGEISAWEVGQNGKSILMVHKGKRLAARVEGPSQMESGLAWPSAGPTSVGFSSSNENASNYLLDLQKGCLHNLGKASGLAQVTLAGRVILWRMPDPVNPPYAQIHYGKLR